MSISLPLNPHQLKKAALVYRATNNKLRQQMLHYIHNNKRVIVTSVYKTLKLEQSVASQHLAILRRAGIVCTEREGKFIFYSINYQRLKVLHDVAETLLTSEV